MVDIYDHKNFERFFRSDMAKTWSLICIILLLNILQTCNGQPMEPFQFWNGGPNSQIIGVLVAVMVSMCAVFILLACVCCTRRSGFKENEIEGEKKVFRNSPASASVINETSLTGDDPGHVNPITSAEFTIFTPLSPPHHNNNVFRSPSVTCYTENETISESNLPTTPQIEAVDPSEWFAETEYNFPRTRLKYIRELGQGWFGRVVEGEAHGIIDGGPQWTPVAVRILESSASAHEQAQFLHDASIYRTGHHPNVLQLLGRSLEASPLLLIQEFCPKRDLKKFLVENRECKDSELMIGMPLRYCCQLASALQFLHENNMSHSDLATRTCQVTSDLNLKLGDYGLAVNQYPMDYYQGTPPIPVRWSAPESVNHTNTTLQPKQVTLEANIWTLAVTFWEICEWGRVPYDWLSDDEVVSQVMDSPHTRLPQPSLKTSYIPSLYRLMEYCWLPIQNRPQINQIYSMLIHLSRTYTGSTSIQPEINDFSMENFDLRWESFKPNTVIKTDNEKTKSASLTNLHGSFDNLTEGANETIIQMDSWLENVASHTDDMQYVRGLSEAIHELDTALASEQTSSSSSFEPTPNSSLAPARSDTFIHLEDSSNLDSFLYLPKRSESGSETEDETWRKRIERGAYSEKVKQKSKSVADLMVLTHIDMNTVKDIFQEELKKLQEERRESLLFVPLQSSNENEERENVNITEEIISGKSLDISEGNMKKPENIFSYDRKEERSSLESNVVVETIKNDSETVPSEFNSKVEEVHLNIDEKNQTVTQENSQQIICNFDTFLQEEPFENKLETSSISEEIVIKQNILSSTIIPQNENEDTLSNMSSLTFEKQNEDSEHIEPIIFIKKEEFSLIQDFINNEIKVCRNISEESTKLSQNEAKQEHINEEILKNIQDISEHNTEINETNITSLQNEESNDESKHTDDNIQKRKENTLLVDENVTKKENSFEETNSNKDETMELINITQDQHVIEEITTEGKVLEEITVNISQNEEILKENLDFIDTRNIIEDNETILQQTEEVLEEPIETLIKIEDLPIVNKLSEKSVTLQDSEIPDVIELIPSLETENQIEESIKKEENKVVQDVFTDIQTIEHINSEKLIDKDEKKSLQLVSHEDEIKKFEDAELFSKNLEIESKLIKEIEHKEKENEDEVRMNVAKEKEQLSFKILETESKEEIEQNKVITEKKIDFILIEETQSQEEKKSVETQDKIETNILINIEEKETLETKHNLLDTETNEKEKNLKIDDEIFDKPEHCEDMILPPPQFIEETKQQLVQEQKYSSEVVTENLLDIDFDEDLLPTDKLKILESPNHLELSNKLISNEETTSEDKPTEKESKESEEIEANKTNQFESTVNIKNNEYSLIQSFINNERNNNQQNLATKSEKEASKSEIEDSSSNMQLISSDITSDLLDTSNVQQINQIFNVFNVLVDHKPAVECFSNPMKSYYDQSVDQNDIVTEINKLLESKSSVRTSSLSNDFLPLVNGINCTLSHKILDILTEEKEEKRENGEYVPKKLADIALNSLQNSLQEFESVEEDNEIKEIFEKKHVEEIIKETVQEDNLKDNLQNNQDTSESSGIFGSDELKNENEEATIILNSIEEDSLNYHPVYIKTSEDLGLAEINKEEIIVVNGKEEDSDEELLKISTDSLELEEQSKNPSEFSLESSKSNPNLHEDIFKEQTTSFVEDDKVEIKFEPKKLSDIVQDSLNKTYDKNITVANTTYNLPDIVLDNLQNKTFVKEENTIEIVPEGVLINIIEDKSLEDTTEDIQDKNLLNLSIESPGKLSDFILDSLPCTSPVNSESTDNISDKTVIEVKDCNEEQSKAIEDSLETDLITSTPFKTKKISNKTDINNENFFSFVSEGDDHSDYQQTRVILGPCEEYGLGLYSGLKTTFGKFSDDDRPEEELLQFSSNFMPYNEANVTCNSVDYSLETWDTFLGKTLEDQEVSPSSVFDNFSPKHDTLDVFNMKKDKNESETNEMNKTYNKNEATFVVEDNTSSDDKMKDIPENDSIQSESSQNSWEPGGGWFLHPQATPEDLTGQIDTSTSEIVDNSYVGFTLDEECVNALRNELAAKLPHAQGMSHEEQQELEDWDSEERSEIIVKYNVYATPLSPIPEESCCDDVFCDQIQHRDGSDSESEWSEPGLGQTSQLEEDILVVDTETHTALILESPSSREPQHRHTPSQDSCCSNDTLFNLEDLNYGHSPQHHLLTTVQPVEQDTDQILEIELEETPKQTPVKTIETEKSGIDTDSSEMNLTYTKPNINIDESDNSNHKTVLQELSQNETSSNNRIDKEDSPKNLNKLELKLDTNAFGIAPLPSPEDIPWRQLPASLLTYNEVVQNDKYDIQDSNDATIENISEDLNPGQDNTNDDLSDSVRDCTLDVDLYSNLTDIRFSGPCDGQLMSTSFSESVDYAEERDWDSGSDTRSSSSGEFIWKEGEHEESLRALHAASHDLGVTDDLNPMDAIEEENSNSSEDSDDCEEDIEETEFVPSAWDAQATPTKSALRSPEKSSKRKSQQKGVWFKKQKYHCVYEYPREPESPIAPPSDLWRPLSDISTFADWELDPESCVAPTFEDTTDDGYDVLDKFITRSYPLSSGNSRHRELYQLNPFPDFGTGLSSSDEDFFISSSARPFQSIGQSQFFPGQNPTKSKFIWQDYQSSSQQSSRDLSDGITPDSGIDDITPASISESGSGVDIAPPKNQNQTAGIVPPLKCLAALAANKFNHQNDQKGVDSSLGGLRHTRNRLKLDLPPSPNSFSSTRTFSIDICSNSNVDDPIINREVPTFTTFGKSRFSVQHVATPTEETSDSGRQKVKNVSFEALPPIKPIKLNTETVYIVDRSENEEKHKPVEMVQGEASLLDSADEDSGIESSANATLERHQQILN